MTVQVDFHTGLADKLGHACRLVRKAYRAGHQVVVTGAPDQLARLDGQLWIFEVGEFIPPCPAAARSACAAASGGYAGVAGRRGGRNRRG